MSELSRQSTPNVVELKPLPHLLALVRCPGCGDEWADLEAALDVNGASARGCRNGCGRLSPPVYDWCYTEARWVRVA
jgi:hypothetical protein